MMRKVAEKLQMARKSVGLSQNQVADVLGISRGKMINIEKGEVGVDINLLDKLAHTYGYSLNFFISDESKEDAEINFAFRTSELSEEDALITSWARRLLSNIRDLEEVCEEAGI